MPEHLRGSHKAAGYDCIARAGIHPLNGARRIWVAPDCADFMRRQDPDWVQEAK